MNLFGYEIVKSPKAELLQKDSSAIRAVILNADGKAQHMKRNYATLAREGFEWNITVYSCITLIMDDIAGIKWKLAKRRGNRVSPILDSPLLDLMMRPNPSQQYTDFIKSYVGYGLCSGNTYVEGCGVLNKPEDPGSPLKKAPVELYAHRPDRMEVIGGKDGSGNLVGGFKYEVGYKKVFYDPSRILHIKRFHPTNDYYGFSPLEAGAVTIDTDNASRKWNMYLLQNHAKPSGVLFVQGNLSTEDRQVLESTLASKYAGEMNSGRPLILEKNDKTDWKSMSMSPVDMDWNSGMKMNKIDICTSFKVPPELIGDATAKTFNSYKEAKKAYYYQCILPYLDDIKNGWNNWLVPYFGEGLFLDYDRDDIEAIQDDRQTVYDMASDLYDKGLATANETRTMVGLPPVNDDFGDVRMISFSDMPVNDLGDADDYQNGPSAITQGTFKSKQGIYLFKNPSSNRKSPNFKHKCFNIGQSEKARIAYGISFNQQRQAWERKLASVFKNELKDDYREVASMVRKARSIEHARVNINHLNHDISDLWRKTLAKQYKAIIPEFGRRTINEIIGAQKDDGISWAQSVSDYIDEFGAVKVDSITMTTQKNLRAILDQGYLAGDSLSVIASAIESASEDLEGRGMLIARTELAGASNYGSYSGALSTGLNLDKGWLAVEDDKTRPDHSDVDGSFVGMGEDFNVGGALMEYPGDPAGGPDETCNCRCTILYQSSKE